MSNRYRGPSIDASFQVSVRLVKRFQMRRTLKIGQSETRISCSGHACYIWYFLPSLSSFGRGALEEKIKMWKVNKRPMPSDGKSSYLARWAKNLKFILITIIFLYVKFGWLENHKNPPKPTQPIIQIGGCRGTKIKVISLY